VVARRRTPRRLDGPRHCRHRRITTLGDWLRSHRRHPSGRPSLVFVHPFESVRHRHTAGRVSTAPTAITLRPTVAVTHTDRRVVTRHVTHRPRRLRGRDPGGNTADTSEPWRGDRRADQMDRPKPGATTPERRPTTTDAPSATASGRVPVPETTVAVREPRSITRHRPTVGHVAADRSGSLGGSRFGIVLRTRQLSTAGTDRRPPAASGRPEESGAGERLVVGNEGSPTGVGRVERPPSATGAGPVGSSDQARSVGATPEPAGRRPTSSVPGLRQGAPDDPGGRLRLVVARPSTGVGDASGTDSVSQPSRDGLAGDRPTTSRSAVGAGDGRASAPHGERSVETPAGDARTPGRSADLPPTAIDRIVDRLSRRLRRDRRIARERGER
jgi:hypothetical protein